MDISFKLIHNQVYVSKSHLLDSNMNEGTLNNLLSKSRTGRSEQFVNYKNPVSKIIWILYESIPYKTKRKLGLPLNEHEAIECISIISKKNKKSNSIEEDLSYIKFYLSQAWHTKSRWVKYTPHYKDYLFDEKIRINFCKTHSLFQEVIRLKDIGMKMKNIFQVYLFFEYSIFRTTSLNSFYNKIKKANQTSIEECLMHDFRRIGRGPYKLQLYVQKTIKKYYSNPARYTIQQVTNKVNQELIYRQKPEISYSTVLRYVSQPEIRNQCEILRLGKKYAEQNLLPYLHRVKPEFSCQVIQIDSTRINIPFLNANNEVSFLNLCVAMDIHSSKILGYSFGINENTIMVLECIKESFINMKIIPSQLIVDNHASYTSGFYKEFKDSIELYGISHRHSRVGNPRDKGHIERWFYTFQTMFLNSLFGSLGNGIKSKKIDSRANVDLENFYKKKENLRTRNELELEIINQINNYNTTKKKKVKKTPNEIFNDGILDGARKFMKEDIALIFYAKKSIKVKNSTIIMNIGNQRHIYIIYNEILSNLVNRLNVLVLFDEKDLSKIYIFNINTNEYYGIVEKFTPVSIIPNLKQKKKIELHQKKIKEMIMNNTKSLIKEIKEGEEELEAIPLKSIENVVSDYESEKKEKENLLLQFTINSIVKETNLSKSIYNKKSMKGMIPLNLKSKKNKLKTL